MVFSQINWVLNACLRSSLLKGLLKKVLVDSLQVLVKVLSGKLLICG